MRTYEFDNFRKMVYSARGTRRFQQCCCNCYIASLTIVLLGLTVPLGYVRLIGLSMLVYHGW